MGTRHETIGARLAMVRRLMRRRGVDAMLLTNRFNVRYCTGFTGEDSFLLVGPRWARLLTDGRFTEQARSECPTLKAFVRDGPMVQAVAAIAKEHKARHLGLEGAHVSVAFRAALEGAAGRGRLKVLGTEIDLLRQRKDAAELAAIRRAVAVAEEALGQLMRQGRRAFVGRTERQVAAELEYHMRMRGAERAAFDTIVACGAHSALPHYRAGETRISRGDFVLLDWGAVVGGYCSDLTRVVFTGRIPPQIARVYETVLRAQQAGVAAIRPGASCESVDAAARGVIIAAGFGGAFSHGLGHGLGLEVHEGPRLGRRAKEPLAAGMVVTVEPGVYLPGVGGVRIEDDVLVTGGGRRRLSRLPRQLEAMMLG